MTTLPRTLVITGGSSGIGAATVKLAVQRGYQKIIYSGTRMIHDVPEELRTLPNAEYVKADVGDKNEVRRLRGEPIAKNLGPLLVVASAGISERGSPEAIAEMERTNIDGTQNLLDSFSDYLDLNSESRFVGVSSIVAAEGIAVQGDEGYQRTKEKIHEIVTNVRPHPDTGEIQAFTLVPGAVDTPMTRKEMVFGLLMAGALGRMKEDASLRAGLAVFLGGEEKLGATAVDTLKNVLGEDLWRLPPLAKIEKLLEKDRDLANKKIQLLLANALAGYDKKAPDRDKMIRDRYEILDRTTSALTAMDVVIRSDLLAERLLDQFESGRIPENRMLKVYSRSGNNAVVKLLSP